jgi:proteic killer suppression protein
MDLRFADDSLDRLETDPKFDAGYSQAIVKAFRKRMQQIRAAVDERDFYELVSLRFEKLKGNRSHQYSMRLNDQWRLIIEFEQSKKGRRLLIKGIEDYH